jgi:hypothetical protein
MSEENEDVIVQDLSSGQYLIVNKDMGNFWEDVANLPLFKLNISEQKRMR